MSEQTPSPSVPSVPPPSANRQSPFVKILVSVLLILAVLIGAAVWLLKDRTSEERRAAEEFVRAVHEGDINKARSMCTSTVDDIELQRTVRQVSSWGKINHMNLGALNRGATTDVTGLIEFEKTNKNFDCTVVKDPAGGTKYLIQSFGFN